MSRRLKYDDLIGVPFVSWGRDPGRGLDCWGLVMEVFRRLGEDLPDLGVDPLSSFEVSAQVEKWRPRFERLERPAVPCIVVLRAMKCFNHTGVVVAPGVFLHSDRKLGVVAERLDGVNWRRRIEGFYRWRG